MCLSPDWATFLTAHGVDAIHWSTVGGATAADSEIMAFAAERGMIVFTHDLDFSALLAATGAMIPSVIQLRAQDIMPEALGDAFLRTLREAHQALEQGALVTIELRRSRIRLLPIRR